MKFPLAEYLVKSLVSQPELVTISLLPRDIKPVLHVCVHERDVAKIMGSRGLVIRALRTVLCSVARPFDEVVVDALELGANDFSSGTV